MTALHLPRPPMARRPPAAAAQLCWQHNCLQQQQCGLRLQHSCVCSSGSVRKEHGRHWRLLQVAGPIHTRGGPAVASTAHRQPAVGSTRGQTCGGLHKHTGSATSSRNANTSAVAHMAVHSMLPSMRRPPPCQYTPQQFSHAQQPWPHASSSPPLPTPEPASHSTHGLSDAWHRSQLLPSISS